MIPEAVVERAMKVQEVIPRAMAKRISWWQAAEIIGFSDRQMRAWRRRYEKFGEDGLWDRSCCRTSPRRVPLQPAERVLVLYREKYFDFTLNQERDSRTREALFSVEVIELTAPEANQRVRISPIVILVTVEMLLVAEDLQGKRADCLLTARSGRQTNRIRRVKTIRAERGKPKN